MAPSEKNRGYELSLCTLVGELGWAAHPATPPRRTHLNFRVPACRRQGPSLRAFASCEGSGFRRSVPTTVPPNSSLACGSAAAESLRPRRKNLYRTCPSQLVQDCRDFGQSAPILSGRTAVFGAASRYIRPESKI